MKDVNSGVVPAELRDAESIADKVQDFRDLSPEDFFEKHGDELAFVLAATKQKAASRVLRQALANMEGQVLVKRTNSRHGKTYAIDVETGTVFGFREMKPGDMAQAFGLSGKKGAPKGTSYIDRRNNSEVAPLVAVVGEDTFRGMEAEHEGIMRNVYQKQSLNTSHAGIYLGARSEEALQQIGSKPMTIAVTHRYKPILENHLKELREASANPHWFQYPDIITCEGGTEDMLDCYDIDVVCDLVDGGSSVLNAEMSHFKVLKRSGAIVAMRNDAHREFEDRMPAINSFLEKFSQATDERFRETHPHLFNADYGYDPEPEEILTLEELFQVMEISQSDAQDKLEKKADKPFYDVPTLAA